MQAEEVQREDESAADAYIAELTHDTAPACHLPHLAALAQQHNAPELVEVRATECEACVRQLKHIRLGAMMPFESCLHCCETVRYDCQDVDLRVDVS